MSIDVLVLTVYSFVLSCAALGLRALGRRSTSPYASRVMAGHLRATGEEPEPLSGDDWPHSEVPRLYVGMAVVAALAATALSASALALQDGALVTWVALAAAAATLLRLVVRRD